ncbi:MAG: MFS transporter [Bacteroidota bacterium]
MPKLKEIPYKWELLGWLWVTFFLGQADRQVFNVVLPVMRDDLGLSDTQMGLIATMMMIAVGLMAPISGRLGDLKNRKHLILFSTICWALASLFTGCSSWLILIILWRMLAAGGGEAFYAPSAFAAIGAWHKESRSRAMAIHQTSLYAGVVLAGYGAGYLGEHFGWRLPFLISGGLGLLLSCVLLFRIKSMPVQNVHNVSNINIVNIFRQLLQKRSVLFFTLAFAGMVFSTIGYLTWMPTFLHESFGLSLDKAGFHSLFWHHIAAFIGVLIGGKWTDSRMKRTRTARADVQIIALMAATPFIIWMGQGSSLIMVGIALVGFGLFRGMYDTNIFAAVFDVLPASMHSLAVGLMTLVAFVIASLSPLILGWIKEVFSMETGLSLLSLGYLFGALSIWLGARKALLLEWESE